MKCTKCGNEFEGQFCNKCGNPANETPDQQNSTYIQPPINVQVNQMPRKKKMGCFVVGLIVVGGIILTLILIGIIGSLGKDDKSTSGAVSDAPSVSSGEKSKSEDKTSSKAADGKTKYVVTIDGVKKAKDYKDQDCIIVDFTFTNNDEEAVMFSLATINKVFQNGVELETTVILDDKVMDSANSMKEIKTGATIKSQSAYLLADNSKVTVEVSELFSFSDDLIATKEFTLE